MTEVVARDSAGRISLRMEGHAGFNPGNDPVCAACSALAYALMGYIINAQDVREVYALDVATGHVRIEASGGRELAGAFECAVIGLQQLAAQYPKNVSVKFLSVS